MFAVLIAIAVISLVSLVFNVGYIVHELGIFPHTRDRSTDASRQFAFNSRYEKDMLVTHGFQVMDPNTIVLRKFGHRDIYTFDDPYRALETVIKRYEERPTRSRYDDLIHLANYICNHVRCDDKINALITLIHDKIQTMPIESD